MFRFVLLLIMFFALPGSARALCLVTGVTSASFSNAIPSGVLSNTSQNAVPTTFSISVSGVFGSGCSIAFKISGTLTSTAGKTVPYSVSTSSGGTPVVSFTTTATSTVPLASATATIPLFLILPAGVYAVGTYVDSSASVQVYESLSPILGATRSVVPTLVISQAACTIGGSASGGSRTLNFSNGKTISTVAQIATFGTIICNNSAVISLTAANGAATSVTPAPTAFQNFFDYVATTTINGGAATLDTSTNAGRGAPETSTGAITSTTTVNAPFSVSVTPKNPAKPLIAGTYNDVLTITIVPN